MVKRVTAFAVAVVAAAALGGATAVGVWEARDDDGGTVSAAPTAEPTPVARSASTLPALVRRTMPAVAEVTAGSGFSSPGGSGTATGSGFLIDRAGHVVTNEHVVSGSETVRVRFGDGDDIQADVVGTDASTDVALLRLEEVPDDVTPLQIGSASTLEIGEPVLAIGSPFGLEGTVTSGIVSALGRELRAPNGFTITDAVQTDAALNQGNSGGPLIDAAGRVVGMNSQISTESGTNAGIGYAVPAETIRKVVDALRGGGTIEHAYLGVTLGDAQNGDGAQIGEVRDGTPAERAGLRPGDVVTEAAGEEVVRGGDLSRAVSDRKPGDRLELTVRRDGRTTKVTVRLGTRPAEAR